MDLSAKHRCGFQGWGCADRLCFHESGQSVLSLIYQCFFIEGRPEEEGEEGGAGAVTWIKLHSMKKNFFTIVILLFSLGLSAQPYNNEWINFSNTYYKFKVGSNGVYRITQPVLASAGLGNVPVQNFQLFRNGKEVPIYTTAASGTLGSSDYIEFW